MSSRALSFRVFVLVVALAWSLQFTRAAQMTPGGNAAAVNDQWANTAEHLTLSGSLIIAVTILWRELGKKDTLLVQSTATVTQALAGAAASNVELRRIIEDSVAAKKELSTAIGLLTERIERLPCTEGLKK